MSGERRLPHKLPLSIIARVAGPHTLVIFVWLTARQRGRIEEPEAYLALHDAPQAALLEFNGLVEEGNELARRLRSYHTADSRDPNVAGDKGPQPRRCVLERRVWDSNQPAPAVQGWLAGVLQ